MPIKEWPDLKNHNDSVLHFLPIDTAEINFAYVKKKRGLFVYYVKNKCDTFLD